MKPNQPSQPTLADIAALTGGAGLACMTLFFFTLTMGVGDGSFMFLSLLGAGFLLGMIGFIAGLMALARQSTPKYNAIIGLITGLINITVIVLLVLFVIALSAAFSGGT